MCWGACVCSFLCIQGGSFCNTFDLHKELPFVNESFVLSFLSGRFTHVLLYTLINRCISDMHMQLKLTRWHHRNPAWSAHIVKLMGVGSTFRARVSRYILSACKWVCKQYIPLMHGRVCFQMYRKTWVIWILSKKDQNVAFKTNYRLMQVKTIIGSILQYFRSSLSYHLFCLLLSGRFTQV